MHKLGLMFHHYQLYINQHIKRDTPGEIDSRSFFVIKMLLEDNIFRCFYHVENLQHPESHRHFQAA
jgi:hypothetical protein